MSSQTSRRVAQALQDEKLAPVTPMGLCKAQESGTSLYSLIPSELARAKGIEQGSDLELGFHPESNTLLVALDGELFSRGLER